MSASSKPSQKPSGIPSRRYIELFCALHGYPYQPNALLLRFLVPRMRDRSREASAQRSLLTGRIVDSYTNIQTVKLFARPRECT